MTERRRWAVPLGVLGAVVEGLAEAVLREAWEGAAEAGGASSAADGSVVLTRRRMHIRGQALNEQIYQYIIVISGVSRRCVAPLVVCWAVPG